MPQSWKYARVSFDSQTALAVAAKLIGWGATGGSGLERGPGLTQSEAVQYAASLASLRHVIASSAGWASVAIYSGTGEFLGTRLVNRDSDYQADRTYLPIVGDARLPTDPEARRLCLAIDRVLTQIAQSERGGEVPEGYGAGPILGALSEPLAAPAALPIGAIAVIVGGAAVAIIGTAAIWRYLDPEVRVRAAAIDAAARNYQARLAVAETTGELPPPSIVETATASAVRAAADEQQQRYWLYGAAGVLGIAGGAIGLAYLRRQAA